MEVNTSLNADFKISAKCCWKWLFLGASHTSFFSATPMVLSHLELLDHRIWWQRDCHSVSF